MNNEYKQNNFTTTARRTNINKQGSKVMKFQKHYSLLIAVPPRRNADWGTGH
jgi:hypothetical protein